MTVTVPEEKEAVLCKVFNVSDVRAVQVRSFITACMVIQEWAEALLCLVHCLYRREIFHYPVIRHRLLNAGHFKLFAAVGECIQSAREWSSGRSRGL